MSARSEEAKRILNSDVFKEATANLIQRKQEEWLRCREGIEARELLWMAAHLNTKDIRKELQRIAEEPLMEVI